MDTDLQQTATRLLTRIPLGSAEDIEALSELMYDELHAIARMLMADERDGHTLQATHSSTRPTSD